MPSHKAGGHPPSPTVAAASVRFARDAPHVLIPVPIPHTDGVRVLAGHRHLWRFRRGGRVSRPPGSRGDEPPGGTAPPTAHPRAGGQKGDSGSGSPGVSAGRRAPVERGWDVRRRPPAAALDDRTRLKNTPHKTPGNTLSGIKSALARTCRARRRLPPAAAGTLLIAKMFQRTMTREQLHDVRAGGWGPWAARERPTSPALLFRQNPRSPTGPHRRPALIPSHAAPPLVLQQGAEGEGGAGSHR